MRRRQLDDLLPSGLLTVIPQISVLRAVRRPEMLPAKQHVPVGRSHSRQAGKEGANPVGTLRFVLPLGLLPYAFQRRQEARKLLDDAAQKRDALRAFALQDAAACPPQHVVRRQKGFAVRAGAAADIAAPEAPNHLLTGYASPDMRQVAFVAAFIDDDGLAVFAQITRNFRQHPSLDGGMGHVFSFEIPEAEAIMAGQQVMIRIAGGDKGFERLPVRKRFLRHTQVVFIGQRPPDFRHGGQAAEQIV